MDAVKRELTSEKPELIAGQDSRSVIRAVVDLLKKGINEQVHPVRILFRVFTFHTTLFRTGSDLGINKSCSCIQTDTVVEMVHHCMVIATMVFIFNDIAFYISRSFYSVCPF